MIAYIIFGISLIAWQLWNNSRFSSILSKVNRLFLVLSLVQIGFAYMQQGINWSVFSISLMVLGGASTLAMLIKPKSKIKIAFLLGTGVLHFLLASSLQVLPINKSLSQAQENDIAEYLVQVHHNDALDFERFVESRPECKIVHRFSPNSADETDLDDFYVLDVLGSSPKKIKKAIEHHPAVKYIEENDVVSSPTLVSTNTVSANESYIFQDPLNQQQWSLVNTRMSAFYEKAKNVSAQKTIKLFILDTGVDGAHEDLKEVYKNSGAKNGKDKKGHGTHCAGIAAAMTGNNVGISSFNFDKRIEIYSEKVLADFGGGTQDGIIKGMINAVDKGADVISMSLGGMSNDKRQKAYSAAVKYATDHNCIVVVAAGNSSSKAINYSPANADGVLTIAASDQNNDHASFSNSLEGIKMGLYAPGVDILSTIPGNRYEKYSGTSMATPFVAGLVSLMKSIKPDLTASEAHEILSESMQSARGVSIVDPESALDKLISK